jgi:4-amino-4-deoxy-L-arabinose transferase-like glycosyltransferase
MLKQAIPKHRWAILLALSINAVLPISVLTDGKVNPEGLHSTLFTVALYPLWRMERQVRRLQGISLKTAAAFGALTGLAVLSKATAGVLVLAAGIVFLWWALRFRQLGGWRLARQRLLGPAVGAGIAWCLVAGWWCGPNLWKYGHPFPHYWNSASKTPGNRYYLETPLLDRRPVSWLLPFDWSEYLEHPVIHNDVDPRPNFWAAVVTGTWTDFYNRGFCRLQGGGLSTRVWGASWGPPYGGPGWYMSNRCLDLFRQLLRVGLGITVLAVLAVWRTVWNYLRTSGRTGSLVLPTNIVLVVFFVMFFAFVFPFDDNAVLNPRYLLPTAAPVCACLALALTQNPYGKPVRWLLQGVLFAATIAVGALLIFERFGS